MAPLDDSGPDMATDASDCANHAWGYLATGVKDAADCISGCRENFLTQMIPKDQQFDRLCQKLTSGDTGSENPFLALYCCDSQLCGVNHMGESGRDPNVNWLIDSCKNMGYQSVVDPGPPGRAYTCGQNSGNQNSPACRQKNTNKKIGGTKDLMASKAASTPGASATATRSQQNAATKTSLPTSTTNSESTETTQTATDSLNPGGVNTSEANANGGAAEIWRPDGLTRGIKVTIGLASFVVFMILCALIWCLFRERRRRKAKMQKGAKFMSPPQTGNRASRPVSSFPVPMAPPARLRERRLLPPLKHLEPTGEKDEVSDKDVPSFPESPVYSPTHYKLSPRRESLMMRRVSDPTKEARLVTIPGQKETQEKHASIHLSESLTLDVALTSPTVSPPMLAPPVLGTSVLSHSPTLNSPPFTSPASSSPEAMSSGEPIPSLLNSELLNSSPLISPVLSPPLRTSTLATRSESHYEPLESGRTTPVPPPRNPDHHAMSLSELVRPLPASMRERDPTPSEGASTRPNTPPRKRTTLDRPITTLGNPSQDSVLTPEMGDHRRTGKTIYQMVEELNRMH